MLMRLSVNINVFRDWSFVVIRAMRRAYNFVRRMFGQPRSPSRIKRSFYGLYPLELAMLPMPYSCGNM